MLRLVFIFQNFHNLKFSGTNLNSELYYKIKCDKQKGYCLHVANCTVKSDTENTKPYRIINENGCTLEPSLFEHVQVKIYKFLALVPSANDK